MARLRGRRGVRNKKIRISTNANEGLQKIDNSSHDLNVEAFDVHGGEIFSAEASDETVNRSCTQEDAQMILDFLESVAVDDDDGGREMAKKLLTFPPSWDDLLSHSSFENTYFNESYGFVGQGVRIRTRIPRSGFDGSPENQEFGRDASKLDYFSVAAFDVYGDDHLTVAASYGATDVAGEAVVQRLEQERGDGGDSGGRRSRRLMMGTRLEEERGNATAGAGGGDRTREVSGGIFGNNGSDGGEVIVKRLKQEGATVAVPVVVVQAVGLMMMVIVITMVLVMVKKEVWW